MSNDEPIGPYPTAEAREVGRAIVSAGMSWVPLVGGAAAELLDVVIRPAVEERREAWFNELGQAVTDMRDRRIDVEDVIGDQRFVTAVLDATRIALGTHLEEKLAMLRACIVKMAMADRPDDFLAMRFLRFVEELSPNHFVVLTYARDPKGWYRHHAIELTEYMAGPRKQAMEDARLGVAGDELDIALRDLGDRGLLQASMIGGIASGRAMYDPLVTSLGSQLLDFVVLMEPAS